MRDFYLDLTKEVPIPDDNDPEVLAAIERGRQDAKAGRVHSRQEVEAKIAEWRTKFATLTKS